MPKDKTGQPPQNLREILSTIIQLYDARDNSDEDYASWLNARAIKASHYSQNIHIKFRNKIERLQSDATLEDRRFYFRFIYVMNLICKQSFSNLSQESKKFLQRSQYLILRDIERYLVDILSSLKKFRSNVTNVKLPDEKSDKDGTALLLFLKQAPHAELLKEIDITISDVELHLGLAYENCARLITDALDLVNVTEQKSYIKRAIYLFEQAIAHNTRGYATHMQDYPYHLYAGLLYCYSLLFDRLNDDEKQFYAENVLRIQGDFKLSDLSESLRFDSEFVLFRACVITNNITKARQYTRSLLDRLPQVQNKKDEYEALKLFIDRNGSNDKKRKAPLTLFTANSTAMSEKNEDVIAKPSLEQIIDFTHLERIEFFLGKNNIIKGKIEIIAEEMQKFKNNALEHPLDHSYTEADVSKEVFKALKRIIELFDTNRFLPALKLLDNTFSKYVSQSDKAEKQADAGINKVKLLIAYLIERCIVLLIEQEGGKQGLVNRNTYFCRNDYTINETESELEVNNLLPQSNVLTQEGQFAIECSNQTKALHTTLFSNPNKITESFTIKSNPIALHSIINARLITEMTEEQRINYIHGIFAAIKNVDAIALSHGSRVSAC